MANVKASTTINQPIEKVSEFMSVNENAHQWLSGLVETRVTSEIEGVGYTWTDVMQMFGRRVEIDFIVTEYERNRKVGFKSTRGPMPVVGSYTFTPAGDSTTVTFNLEAQLGGFFKLAEPIVARMMQRQWETNLANLKDVLEMQG